MSRRVLMASWLFPPHGSIGAKRAYRFARHLPSHGWEPTVVCRRRVPDALRDPSAWSLPTGARVVAEYDAAIFVRLEDALSLPRRKASTANPVSASLGVGLGARWRDRWHRAVDAMVPTETAAIHAPHLYRVLDRLAPSHDVLWTTSYPYHAHLVGAAVARRHGMPFVADLRDPWTPNWVHRQKLATTRWVERRCERETIEAADAIVVTTETLAERYRAMFPVYRDKFVAIHNSFDPDGGIAGARAEGPRVLVHFGNVYGPWSLATTLRALAYLRATDAPGSADVVLENYGKMGERDRRLVVELGLHAVVRVRPPLGYTEGIARLRAADLLLLAAWDAPDAGLYIQGKLYDYLLAGRDLVAETASPEVTDIVRRTGAGAVVAPGDIAGMTEVLRRALAGDALSGARDAAAVDYFSSPQASQRLAQVLDGVLDGAQDGGRHRRRS